GDGPHFADVRREFGAIDLLMLEAGQYNVDWSSIHLMPDAWR
ncbi:hypothetical protein HMPREF9440_02480, partial [Sutterella parvirubra YIT 11816]